MHLSYGAFGKNENGKLGNNTNNDNFTDTPSVVMVPEDVNFVKVVSSYDHTLFLASNGDVYGAGSNTEGQLGDSVTTSSNTPTLIASEVIDIDTYIQAFFVFKIGWKFVGKWIQCIWFIR